ncbi:MAG: pyridoxal phosphate-dependent aminotransferase [Euryarchaeota archaeon]|nr:pyridoxal phosphate-dependent aminotransferase [Euryarchaeota archaeon]MBU4608793.1 pyridoxal phosphate-dependent aminotransferase [Euryarchaeota archaeon]MBV1729884.1 pyridoxal phosphate-dependent aminotransferase [Methanobacterium sp.]MBV1753991.1 pyridoxal phosphate-dependent aminotransferase [Methanobacterium sp.]
MINPANRVKSIELSQIRKMFEKTSPDAINLGIGEPDFDTPPHIRRAVVDALEEGFTHYTSNKGIIELREAISEKLKADNNIQSSPEEIIVTVGASEALYMCTQALVNPGDEVLIPDPGFLSYDACVKLAEGKPIPIPLKKENNFQMTVADVEERITPKTKALILNSPSNPTGSVMKKEDVKAIAELTQDKGIFIISDEIYEKIIYEGQHHSPGEFSDKAITINGFSKTYAMTGFRVAYAAAQEEIIEELLKVHQYNTACASSISQKGAFAALEGPQDCVADMVGEFKRRRDMVVSRLNEMGWPCSLPEGAFYIFPAVGNSFEFVKKALENEVVVVPGEGFGKCGENHIRISYATSYDALETALDRMESIKL